MKVLFETNYGLCLDSIDIILGPCIAPRDTVLDSP